MRKQSFKLIAHLVGKLTVKLHYARYLDIYSLCSLHEPERYLRTQRKAKIPVSTRWAVWYRDNYTCVYCGLRGDTLSLDHVVPESCGGSNAIVNLLTSCLVCNHKKAATNFKTFIHSEWLKTRIQKIEKMHQRSLTTKVRQKQTSPQMKEMLLQIANATGRNVYTRGFN